MEARSRQLIDEGNDLFSKRHQLLSLWQETALNFYVERADFTMTRSIGAEFAEHLMTSVPLLVRRELGSQFSSMLRPTAKQWFHSKTNLIDEKVDDAGREWLEFSEQVMQRAMYDPFSQFVRATKEGDNDFATFGQAVISVGYNRDVTKLNYRCWHLRDCAWAENEDGIIDTMHRKQKMAAREIARKYPKHHPKIDEMITNQHGFDTVEIRHIVVPSDRYDSVDGGKRFTSPFVSIFIDVENDGTIMEEKPAHTLGYIIPRWVTVPGSQYAYSPATVCALPEARLLQAITLTILEAGEKASNPPMISVGEVIRSDYQLYAGGITQVDAEYDERTGEALRPVPFDFRGLPQGTNMADRAHQLLIECFYLNKLSPFPQTQNKEETAYEVGQRVQDYIRQALPLFEPMEMEYNGALCMETFFALKRVGAFGPPDAIPESIRGQLVKFQFESPLHDAIDAQLGQKLGEAKALLAQVADIDPSAAQMLNAKVALRDALRGIGVPARWNRSEEEMEQLAQQAADEQRTQALLDTLGKGANVAKTAGEAVQAFGGAGQSGAGAPITQQPSNVKVAA